MKKRALIILFLLIVLLASNIALVRSTATVGREPPTSAGYHLSAPAYLWLVSGSSSAPGYILMASHAPSLTGNGCCCDYLPCVFRNLTP